MGQADSLDKQEANDAERMRSGIAELMQLAYDQAQSQGQRATGAAAGGYRSARRSSRLALNAARMTMFHMNRGLERVAH